MHAPHENVPRGPHRDFGIIANSCFEQWFTKPDALRLYAETVLAILSVFADLQETTRQLQRLHLDTARACNRLVSLLKKAACAANDGLQATMHLLQPQGLLARTGCSQEACGYRKGRGG